MCGCVGVQCVGVGDRCGGVCVVGVGCEGVQV